MTENIKIIGTSHIAKQSLKEVEDAINNFKPDIIALELDRKRMYGLMSNQKSKPKIDDVFRIGFKGFLFSLIGAWAEKKLGEIVGVSPGDEMKIAIKLAKEKKIKIAMIDQDIEITLKKFSKSLSWKEKWNFLVDLVKAFIFRKKEIDFDLRTVPSEKVIKKLIDKVKDRYPNVYNVLIAERNEVMARRLNKIMQKNPELKIVAVIGAGHKSEVEKMLNKSGIWYSYSIG